MRYFSAIRSFPAVLVTLLLAACGGGGGGSSSPPPNPVPSISSISPSSVTAGGAAFTLTVNGSNFMTASTVQWNNSSRTTTYVKATQLTASISAADIATVGTLPVTVINPAPGGGASAGFSLAVNNPPPPPFSYNCLPTDPAVKFIESSVSAVELNPGQIATVQVTLVNCSGASWSQAKLIPSLPFRSVNWGISQVPLPTTFNHGQGIKLGFDVVAPAARGSYVLQWAVNDSSGAENAPPSPPTLLSVGSPTVCTAAQTVKDTGNDARAVLQTCIDNLADAGILEIPAGTYVLNDPLIPKRAITIRTQGTRSTQETCLNPGAPNCAILQASPGYPETHDGVQADIAFGLFTMMNLPFSVTFDHLVLDGNRPGRLAHLQYLEDHVSSYPYLAQLVTTQYWFGSHGFFFRSAFINTVGSQALALMGKQNVAAYNFFGDSGDHLGRFSDGLFMEGYQYVAMYNHIQDSSDIDLALFGGVDSHVHFNTVLHTKSSNAAFGGMTALPADLGLYQQMADIFGGPQPVLTDIYDYSRGSFSNNYVNCNWRCAVAVDVTGGLWLAESKNNSTPAPAGGVLSDYTWNIFGGTVAQNIVRRGLQGMTVGGFGNVAGSTPMTVSYNTILESGGYQSPVGDEVSNNFNVTSANDAIMSGNSPLTPTLHNWLNDGILWWFNLTANPVTPEFTIDRAGAITSATCEKIEGWACAEEAYFSPLMVQLFKDAPSDAGGVASSVGWSNIDRPDATIANSCAGGTMHGFSIPTPAEYKDNHDHKVYAYGLPKLGSFILQDSGQFTLNCAP